MKKDKRGITLIGLVLTIIVLLVLAGVSLSLVLGDNGVLNKAKQAATDMDIEDLQVLIVQ